tara:strand:+ start:2455 stop:2703 length:249 start_codon:yes stop_codon:yes gene_type:complete
MGETLSLILCQPPPKAVEKPTRKHVVVTNDILDATDAAFAETTKAARMAVKNADAIGDRLARDTTTDEEDAALNAELNALIA